MKELVEAYRAGRRPAGSAATARKPDGRPFAATREYAFRTGRVLVDDRRCAGCTSLACVRGCSLYGGYLYRVRAGKMVLGIPPEEFPRRCNECLACEFECPSFHNPNAYTLCCWKG